MIISCILILSSCTAKPEMDIDEARDNFEDEDYNVDYYDDLDHSQYEEYLYAYNDDNELHIILFKDSKLASIFYDKVKADIDYKRESIKREIESMEHILKKYDDNYTSSEIDDMEDELKELRREQKKLNKHVIGKSGKTIWFGTEDAIKDSKG